MFKLKGKSELGATLTEYALILALVVSVAGSVLSLFGTSITGIFNTIVTTLG